MSVKKKSKSKGAIWFGKRLSAGATSNLYIISIIGLLVLLVSVFYTVFDIYEEILESVEYDYIFVDIQYYLISFMMEGIFIIFFLYSIIACKRGR